MTDEELDLMDMFAGLVLNKFAQDGITEEKAKNIADKCYMQARMMIIARQQWRKLCTKDEK